jgi:PD-(D/E)XK nuclease superfamily protein
VIESLLKEKDELALSGSMPHLSHSRINRYLLCPEQYRFYYIENLRLKFPSASLVFGQVVHQALADLFNKKIDPIDFFLRTWGELKGVRLTYGKKQTWEKLQASGQGLLQKFLQEELCRIGQVKAVEKKFELSITGFDLPFIGIIDLVAEVEGKNTVADFKTAASDYEDHEAPLSDQLSAYKLAEPEAEQVAFWVMIKTKEPKIEWYPSSRSPKQLMEYISKVGYLAREIKGGSFYKRPGKHCSWCDYLPICLGDVRKVKESLIQVA